MTKQALEIQAKYNDEHDKAERLKPANYPWWLFPISVFIYGIIYIFVTAVFKIGGLLPTIVIGSLSLYAPKHAWMNSDRYARKLSVYKRAADELEAKFKDMLNSPPDLNA